MENKIKKLFEKYRDRGFREPQHYLLCEEFGIDLQSLLKFKQKNCCGKVGENENAKDKT